MMHLFVHNPWTLGVATCLIVVLLIFSYRKGGLPFQSDEQKDDDEDIE